VKHATIASTSSRSDAAKYFDTTAGSDPDAAESSGPVFMGALLVLTATIEAYYF
jgi:hypothetical protein